MSANSFALAFFFAYSSFRFLFSAFSSFSFADARRGAEAGLVDTMTMGPGCFIKAKGMGEAGRTDMIGWLKVRAEQRRVG